MESDHQVYRDSSSSSHALTGGLVGAEIARGGAGIVVWSGLMEKVIIPHFTSALLGFAGGFALMLLLYALFARTRPPRVNRWFWHLQLFSSILMAFSHGCNDTQKSMGAITLALVIMGLLAKPVVPIWVILACATAMALETTAGGWRIIKTMGHKIVRLELIRGFAAEITSSSVLLTTAHFGRQVSTMPVISSSILGVGSSRRFSAVRWVSRSRWTWRGS